MRRNDFNTYITEKNFNGFFIELGWNHVHPSDRINPICIDEVTYNITPVADKQGFKVLVCCTDELPQHTVRKKLDIQLRRYFHNYILIFTLNNSEHQLWMVPVKTVDKRDIVVVEYLNATSADFLFSKISNLCFGLEEETNIVDVTHKVHGAFEVNSEKVTRDFYAGFKQQHKSFANFIQGIDVEGDKQWYASVMLNRLMFCYFIQKKGFLNFDTDYLRNKLAWTKLQRGNNQFFSTFYKGFLKVLFHGGLNHPVHNRQFEAVYGRIPYLNGGMFDEHQLEKQYADIDIADDAFERLFEFFDKWRWHLDTRITATGKDINPDVLGYIFEQYINNRAKMGAYYTKEDITEYIGKNCIIPFLMDEVAKTSSGKHFTPNGYVWQMVKNSGDKYIYPAVKKGVDLPLPDYIEVGIDTTQPNLLERRSRWNEPAFEQHALPTEIWRETVERRQRCYNLRNKINNGEITHINDFITYNLDIRSFVQDLLEQVTDHRFILHFYHALQRITILDPTCGSGAFLFAALNILEPLYEICIARMEEFNRENPYLFKDELAEITNKYRSNIQHFIYKSIILRNLYGVDIMVEATEIAKLRLFLKMVAVVDVNPRADNLGLDPLPDIDFNIRCGNTLVGYATEAELEKDLTYGDMFANLEFKEQVEEGMEKVARTYQRFKEIQLNQHSDMESFTQAKTELNTRLKELNHTLNQRLFSTQSALNYDAWLASHQPFHWLAEFYQIIKGNGGFDVIIGNPPYVEYGTKLKSIYTLRDYDTLQCGNLHAYIAERGLKIISNKGFLGLIIPLPSISTSRMVNLQKIIKPKGHIDRSVWISAFDERPSSLFDGVDQRLIIEILSAKVENPLLSTTGINRWGSATRFNLFFNLSYAVQDKDNLNYGNSILKIKNNKYESSILKKFYLNKPILNFKSDSITNNLIYYRTAGGRYWKVIEDKPSGTDTVSEKAAYFRDIESSQVVALISSSTFWWYYSCHFDMFNLKDYMIFGFRFSNSSSVLLTKLKKLGNVYLESLQNYAEIKIINSKTKGIVEQKQFVINKSKPIIDEIDKVLAAHYGFTEEELDFIINYDIKYRMGKELEGDEP
ncbi:MAG: hypothetical protein BWY27_01146 [Bacteroidetes bacterium ADurb.Bin234]|nr:MAG: hypothetical protein BWY27_01146 [Bacteroidetes bacterium ADurb.Bin234]